jgi:NTP pyrophosphatase (non-canonical NTP hydrolase)
MSELDKLINELIQFRDERDWEQFHNSKDLALGISIEAAELNELFLWKSKEQVKTVSEEKIKEELADVLNYCFLLAKKHNLSPIDIVREKLEKNRQKYPIDKAKGSAKKYNEL